MSLLVSQIFKFHHDQKTSTSDLKYYQQEERNHCQGNNKSTHCTFDRGTSANLTSPEEANNTENTNKEYNPINKQVEKIQKSDQDNDTPIPSTSGIINKKKGRKIWRKKISDGN